MVLLAGCSLVVESTLEAKQGDPDSGPTGSRCTTTDQCLRVEGQQFDCTLQCVGASAGTQGTCVSVAAGTPDGTPCGDEGEICVERECVTRGCGDGYVDRAATPPEYCDDGDTNDSNGCNNMCTRPCVAPAPTNCSDGNSCNGDETCGAAGVCEGSALEADGTSCRTGGGDTGMCVRGACVVE